jgi:hypothetical protein
MHLHNPFPHALFFTVVRVISLLTSVIESVREAPSLTPLVAPIYPIDLILSRTLPSPFPLSCRSLLSESVPFRPGTQVLTLLSLSPASRRS